MAQFEPSVTFKCLTLPTRVASATQAGATTVASASSTIGLVAVGAASAGSAAGLGEGATSGGGALSELAAAKAAPATGTRKKSDDGRPWSGFLLKKDCVQACRVSPAPARWFRQSAAAEVTKYGVAAPYSSVLEHRLALVHKRVHAFLLVGGGKQRVEQAALKHHAVG